MNYAIMLKVEYDVQLLLAQSQTLPAMCSRPGSTRRPACLRPVATFALQRLFHKNNNVFTFSTEHCKGISGVRDLGVVHPDDPALI